MRRRRRRCALARDSAPQSRRPVARLGIRDRRSPSRPGASADRRPAAPLLPHRARPGCGSAANPRRQVRSPEAAKPSARVVSAAKSRRCLTRPSDVAQRARRRRRRVELRDRLPERRRNREVVACAAHASSGTGRSRHRCRVAPTAVPRLRTARAATAATCRGRAAPHAAGQAPHDAATAARVRADAHGMREKSTARTRVQCASRRTVSISTGLSGASLSCVCQISRARPLALRPQHLAQMRSDLGVGPLGERALRYVAASSRCPAGNAPIPCCRG